MRLPSPPASLTGPVKAWSAPLTLPTYEPLPADRNPMFLEKRVFQGSSGRVYPLPFIDRISQQREERDWLAVHIENEFLHVVVLPELGGRIYAMVDKINGYDVIYRNPVIKPALVGLAGPWISGGIEFNWPQHHRPSTFMPVDVEIEADDDGSRTVWLSEHEPMNRMKGMHGIRLLPGKAYLEVRVRLYNRTELPQTFMWWANVATDVHDRYQSFFPDDVRYVADHAKRAISTFPLCSGRYYGIDYAARALGNDDSPNDLRWYKNIPVPTSYMAIDSKSDFFGGYDHQADAGIVHYSNHHVSPGKKQWTWGCDEFGKAWDRNLTEPDEDGRYHPYFELMAGVYTDNQPDFSFIAPGETKTFSQYWYPIRQIGPVRAANLQAAISLSVQGGRVRVGVQALEALPDAIVTLAAGDRRLSEWHRDLIPERPMVETMPLPPDLDGADLRVTITGADGRPILDVTPPTKEPEAPPRPATEPLLPAAIESADELFLTGLHLAQYRHATRQPEDYWREALRRDPMDCRCNNAMGLWHFRRAEFAEAEACFQRAVTRLQSRNPNPYDGEAFYNLGLTLRHLGRPDDAYDAFYKATWNAGWRAAAYHQLAELDAGRRAWDQAQRHIEESLRYNADNLRARDLKVICLRSLGRQSEAETLLRQTLALDPLDQWARHLTGRSFTGDSQLLLDLADDYARAGLIDQAFSLLNEPVSDANGKTGLPLIHYHAAFLADRLGRAADATRHRQAARDSAGDYCFPARLEDVAALRAAIEADPADGRASYYLGSLFYDRRRHRDAIALWEGSAKVSCGWDLPIVWRNLGIGYFNILKRPDLAADAFERAFRLARSDGRLLFERDQLWKRIGRPPETRLRELESYRSLVAERDDLSVELCALYTRLGRPEDALSLLIGRRFQPWEGGEGLALEQYVRARLALGRRALVRGDALRACDEFGAALIVPPSLGEAAHPLANRSDVFYWLGRAYAELKDRDSAQNNWRTAADFKGDFLNMEVRRISEKTYYSALSMRCLGLEDDATSLFKDMISFAEDLLASDCKIDYFATSLPTMLIFEDDLKKRRDLSANFILAQGLIGLGRQEEADAHLRQVLSVDPNHSDAADLSMDGLVIPNAGG
ncbi:DUF5107 domain-containing protein [Telmatospirillum sp.]|uniref:DUF5107 domain-containing protein n=1 Tax=Telmatospirillum sp. TaxID=2079197 RepID=UPI0028525C74|nr:DUF5107 domain-containing protein [Telmatospirillum sp.]